MKTEFHYGCLPVNYPKFLERPFLKTPLDGCYCSAVWHLPVKSMQDFCWEQWLKLITSDWQVQKQPPKVFYKKLFLGILQYSQENIWLESLFIKVARLRDWHFVKKRLQHKCFLVNILKFLRTSILKNILRGAASASTC